MQDDAYLIVSDIWKAATKWNDKKEFEANSFKIVNDKPLFCHRTKSHRAVEVDHAIAAQIKTRRIRGENGFCRPRKGETANVNTNKR